MIIRPRLARRITEFGATVRGTGTQLLVLWVLALTSIATASGFDSTHLPSAQLAALVTVACTFDFVAGQKRVDEAEQYGTFYIAVVLLVLLIEIVGGVYVLTRKQIKWKHVMIVGVAGVRSFDMMSDWVRNVAVKLHTHHLNCNLPNECEMKFSVVNTHARASACTLTHICCQCTHCGRLKYALELCLSAHTRA